MGLELFLIASLVMSLFTEFREYIYFCTLALCSLLILCACTYVEFVHVTSILTPLLYRTYTYFFFSLCTSLWEPYLYKGIVSSFFLHPYHVVSCYANNRILICLLGLYMLLTSCRSFVNTTPSSYGALGITRYCHGTCIQLTNTMIFLLVSS